jgi:UDP-N-acetylmuramate dehydrogenase
MDERQRKELVKIGGGEVRFDCPMSQYTTFRVGGSAEALYLTQELHGLKRMVSYLREEHIPCLVVGKGSNLLVRDGGLTGVVVILKGELATVGKNGQNDQIVVAGGGLGLGELVSYCTRTGLGGLEFLAGIPGTVGGAVAMNAGAFGKDMGSMVKEVQILIDERALVMKDRSQLKFSYGELELPKGAVILGVRFELDKEDPEIISQSVEDYVTRRKAKQPLEFPSGGSVFKNPPNDYAGRLIEEAGLKGRRIGGAMISPKHANFIVNTSNAGADDILALMDLIREKVKEESGIELEPEIQVVGNR